MTRLLQSIRSGSGVRYATLFASAILVAALAHSLAQLTWRVLPAHAESVPAAPAGQQRAERGATDGRSAGDDIAGLHLFGRAGDLDQEALREIPVDAPDTRLNLTLRGILYDPSDRLAMVIISQGNRSEEVFRVGGELSGGATIDAILRDRVILLREGRHETLRLPDEQVDRTETALDTLPGASDDDEDNLPGASGAGGEHDEMRQTLLENPAEFTRYVQPQPYMDGDEFRGFRLQPGSDPQIMESVGLEPGDVVTAINGQLLEDPQGGITILRDAAQQNRLELTILRDGANQTVTIDFDN